MQWLRFSNCVDVWRRNQDHAFQLMNKCLRSMDRAVLAKAFRQWFHGTLHEARAQQAKNAFARVARELATEQNRNCFFFQLARSTHDPLRALRRLGRLDAWRALQTWVDFTVDAVAVRDRLVMAAKTVGQVLCNSEARVLFAGMRAWTLFCRASRKCERLCMKWAYVLELSAWKALVNNLAQGRLRAGATKTVLKGMCQLLRANLFTAMRTWERLCRYAAVRDHDTIVATLRQNEAVTRALRLLQSSSARSLAAAWGGWRMDAQDARKRKTLMRRVMGRLASQLAAQARVVQVNFSLGRQSSNIRLPLGTLDKFAMP